METFKEQLKISIFGNTQNECLPYRKKPLICYFSSVISEEGDI